MKCLYWNIRGLANSPSRLALKRILIQHKPDFCFIAEPWMNFDDFPSRWLSNVGMKAFSLNVRNNLIPNLWCFCKLDFDPVVVSVDDQQVSFMISVHDVSFGISAIYASTNYVKRRQLWTSLSSLHNHFQVPWCYIGDFNAIIGANEHKGDFPPAECLWKSSCFGLIVIISFIFPLGELNLLGQMVEKVETILKRD
jgi:hypothetical protein